MGLLAHETTQVRVGQNFYAFRTLSLVQVYREQQNLKILKNWVLSPDVAAAAGDPLNQAALYSVCAAMCSEMLLIRPTCAVVSCRESGPHADVAHLDGRACLEISRFYLRQDWTKLKVLLEEFADQPDNTDKPDEKVGTDEAWRTFMMMCGISGQLFGLDYEQFAQLRFEEAADMMIAVVRARRKARGDEMKNKSNQPFIDAMIAKHGLTEVAAEAPVEIVPDPPWLTDN